MSIKLFFLVHTYPKNKITKWNFIVTIKFFFFTFYASNGMELLGAFRHDFLSPINNLDGAAQLNFLFLFIIYRSETLKKKKLLFGPNSLTATYFDL